MSASAIRQEQSLERWLTPLLPPGDEHLGHEDLLRLVCGIGAAREAWSPFVHHDPAVHQAVCLHKETALELWLVCWLDGQSTGVHRHEGRSGCVYVADGCLLEDVFEEGPANRAFTRSYRRRKNTAFCFTASRAHIMRSDGPRPAISLHAYAPTPARADLGTAVDEELERLCRRRWTPAIVEAIAVGTVRYTQIRNACPGINPGTLTGVLRELERLGVVRRTWFDESPPRVEYALTADGRRQLRPLRRSPAG
jgi:DNA-binding HxlR family transcriptional regulator